MKLDIDFSELWGAVKKMGAAPTEFELNDIWSEKELSFDIELEGPGVSIDLEDLETSQGLLSARGRQVILFIPDQGSKIEEVLRDPSHGKKFHIADCATLDTMRRRNRFERYRVTNNLSGDFPVFGQSHISQKQIEGSARLSVCKNCLNMLNYKGADTHGAAYRNELVANFDLHEFFSTFSSVFKRLPRRHIHDNERGYSSDWEAISADFRKKSGYRCGSCKVELSEYKRLLHVHHINGEKSDNSESNLIALCADCHRKEPYHGHMNIPREDMLIITNLRTRQRGTPIDEWHGVLKLADPAVQGVLDYCRRNNWIAPIVGYELVSAHQEVIGELELAWPSTRVGVSIGDGFAVDGWEIYDLKQALARFK